MENVVGTYIKSESKIIHVILNRMAWVLLSDLSDSEVSLIKRRCIYIPKKDRFNKDPKPVTLFEEMVIDGKPHLGVPKGYMVHLIELADSKTKFDITDNRNEGKVEPVEFIGSPRPYQVPIGRDLITGMRDNNAFNMGICEASTGCLSGDTVVTINRGGGSRKKTLKQLAIAFGSIDDKFAFNPRGEIVRPYGYNLSIDTKTRSFLGDRIGLKQFESVVFSGIKTVYRLVLENGFTIKATACHKFQTIDGMARLDSLTSKDSVMVDVNVKPKPSGIKCKKIHDNHLVVGRGHPFHQKVFSRGKDRYRIEKHRAIFEANDNNLSLEDYLGMCRSGDVSNLRFVDPSIYDIHHIDFNHYNNDFQNLQKLEKSEHQRVHGLYNFKSFNQGILSYSKVVSVEIIGEEETFDIIDVHETHNFVANGIVVSNSGKTFLFQRMRNKLSVRAVLPFHKAKLMWVWIRSVRQFEPDAKIGIIGQLEDDEPDENGKFKKRTYCDFEDCDYVFCLYQTLISDGFAKKLEKKGWSLEKFYNYFGMMGYDEINRGGSEKFSTAMRKFNVKYILGLTGTLRRSDGNVGILNSYCGKTLHKFEGFATEEPYVHFVQTGFQFDLQKYPKSANMEIMSYSNRVLPKIASRNQLIVSKLLQALGKKRNIILFCHTHNLINEIHRILKLNIEKQNLPYKVGRYTAKSARSEILFCENEANVVIATKKDADDGIDIPRLDTVFLVDPQGDAEQMIGRILRSFDGDENFPAKQKPLVVYFIDKTSQSKSMVHAFIKIVMNKKAWKSNYKAFFNEFNDNARSFKSDQEKKKNNKVIIRKRVNGG